MANAARASEEAGRQQLACMIDEQLAQTQTFEALHRQVETCNNADRDAQALLRSNQDQQLQYLRMPPPSTFTTTIGQHSLCPTLCNSIDRAAHMSVSRSGILPCGFTAGPRICRTDEGHV